MSRAPTNFFSFLLCSALTLVAGPVLLAGADDPGADFTNKILDAVTTAAPPAAKLPPGSIEPFNGYSFNQGVPVGKLPLDAVELVAITYNHSSDDNPWWKPDGMPYTAKALSADLPVRIGTSGLDVASYDFFFHAPSVAAEASWVCQYGSPLIYSQSQWGKLTTPDGDDLGPAYMCCMGSGSKFCESVDIKLSVAAGAWETAAKMEKLTARVDTDFDRGTKGEFWRITLLPPEEIRPDDDAHHPEGGTKIAVVHTFNQTPMEIRRDWDVRLVAVDREGQEHPVREGTFGGNGNYDVTEYFFPKLTLAGTKEFRFQVRPYQVFEFPHVALRPWTPPLAPVATSATFGPVVERDLPLVDPAGQHGEINDNRLDLKSGNFVKPGTPGDLGASDDAGRGYRYGYGLTVVGTSPSRWDATPGEVLSELAHATPEPESRLAAGSKTPQTYFFRTREGVSGTLQLSLNDSWDTVHARYKLLQPK